VIEHVDPDWDFVAAAFLPEVYGDVSIAFDARLVSGDLSSYVGVACRIQPGSFNQYRLSVSPWLRVFDLARWDDGEETTLLQRADAAIRLGDAPNRVELTCAGNLISARINGTLVAVAEDATYQRGSTWIGLGASEAPAEARLDNLVVSQAAPGQVPTPTPRPTTTPGPSPTPRPSTLG
jgi:hypothetical protein